ncbi:MAG: c-type cytochrome domain-containing protein, partial [Bacteroidota bacterium]
MLQLLVTAAVAASIPFWRIERVDFNTQIRPILNKSCLPCHGGVKQQANLSFISREEAMRPAKSGRRAIVPGNPEASELIRRIEHHDPELRMPYQKEALSAAETALLRRWIREGANWDLHWAFKPVEAPAIPKTEAAWYEFWRKTPDEDWPRRDLDRFVLHRLQGEN